MSFYFFLIQRKFPVPFPATFFFCVYKVAKTPQRSKYAFADSAYGHKKRAVTKKEHGVNKKPPREVKRGTQHARQDDRAYCRGRTPRDNYDELMKHC